MKTGKKIILGCLATPLVILVGMAVLFLIYRVAPMNESRQTAADLEQPTESPTLEQLAAEGLVVDGSIPAGRAMTVNMRLEEGLFIIKPGPPGSAFRVEGEYDEGTFELTQSMEQDSSGNPVYTLTYLPRYSMLRRLLSQGFVKIDDDLSRLTIWVPRDVPMTMNLTIRKGESRMDLSGLAIRQANFVLAMGEHEVRVEEPNPIQMTTVDINASMGEFTFSGLGLLRAGSITTWGKMGELDLDLGREISRDTELFAKMRMGEVSIGVPRDARVDAKTTVFLGESSGAPKEAEETSDDPDSPRYSLKVRAGVTMGELRYVRH